MADLTQDEVVSKVSSIFDVKDIVINTNDIRLKIEDKDFKNKFVDLARQLENPLAQLSLVQQATNLDPEKRNLL